MFCERKTDIFKKRKKRKNKFKKKNLETQKLSIFYCMFLNCIFMAYNLSFLGCMSVILSWWTILNMWQWVKISWKFWRSRKTLWVLKQLGFFFLKTIQDLFVLHSFLFFYILIRKIILKVTLLYLDQMWAKKRTYPSPRWPRHKQQPTPRGSHADCRKTLFFIKSAHWADSI